MSRFQILLVGQTLPILFGAVVDICLKHRLLRKMDRIVAKWDEEERAKQRWRETL